MYVSTCSGLKGQGIYYRSDSPHQRLALDVEFLVKKANVPTCVL